MGRIVGGVVIFHVACVALSVGAGQVVVAIDVALQAGHGGVEPGEGPSGTGVIESATAPIRRVVALLASLREPGLQVIGVSCGLVILQMAADAGRVSAG